MKKYLKDISDCTIFIGRHPDQWNTQLEGVFDELLILSRGLNEGEEKILYESVSKGLLPSNLLNNLSLVVAVAVAVSVAVLVLVLVLVFFFF